MRLLLPCLAGLAALVLGTGAIVAQETGAGGKPVTRPETPANGKQGTLPPAVHEPHPQLPPHHALQHLRQGHTAALKARLQGEPAAEPRTRPAGAGRWVVAVFVCPEAGVDPAALFGLRQEDVLVISSPGTAVSAEDVALLERAAAEQRLSLCLVLTHPECVLLQRGTVGSPAQDSLERSAEPGRRLARERALPLAKAQAIAQRNALVGASELLSKLSSEGRFLAVPASVFPRTGELHWHTTAAEELPLSPVK